MHLKYMYYVLGARWWFSDTDSDVVFFVDIRGGLYRFSSPSFKGNPCWNVWIENWIIVCVGIALELLLVDTCRCYGFVNKWSLVLFVGQRGESDAETLLILVSQWDSCVRGPQSPNYPATHTETGKTHHLPLTLSQLKQVKTITNLITS